MVASLVEHEGGYSFIQNFRDILQIPVFDYELLAALEVCAYVVLGWWFARRFRSREDWPLLAFLIGVFGLAAGHLAKFAQTVLTIHPFQAGWGWYFVPAYLLMTLIVPVNCGVVIHFIRRFIGPRWPRAANILSVGIVFAGAVFLFAKADFTEPFQRVEHQSKTLSSNPGVMSLNAYSATLVVNRVLPEDSVLGSWDAGTIGYFSRFPVVNLDGLVNSYDYLRARSLYAYRRARNEVTEAALYQRYGVTHFANSYPVSATGTPCCSKVRRITVSMANAKSSSGPPSRRRCHQAGSVLPTGSGSGWSGTSTTSRTTPVSLLTGDWYRPSPRIAIRMNWSCGPGPDQGMKGMKQPSIPGRERKRGCAWPPALCPTPYPARSGSRQCQ